MANRVRTYLMIASLTALAAAGSAVGSELTWTGTSAGAGRFFDAAAWSGTIPTELDDVRFGAGASTVTLDNEFGLPTVHNLSLDAGASLSLVPGGADLTYDPTLYFGGAVAAGAGASISVQAANITYLGSGAVVLPQNVSLVAGVAGDIDSYAVLDFSSASSLSILGTADIALGDVYGKDVTVAPMANVRIRTALGSSTRFDVYGAVDAQNGGGLYSTAGGAFHSGSTLAFSGDQVDQGYLNHDYGDPSSDPIRFEPGSTISYDFVSNAGYGDGNDYFYVEGNLEVLSGTIFELNFRDGFVPAAGSLFTLADAENQLVGPATELVPVVTGLPAGLGAVLDFDVDNLRLSARIVSVPIPEPASAAVVACLAALALRRRTQR